MVYVYAPDRKAERPIAHLAGFTACCRSTAMAATRCWPGATSGASRSAGPTWRRRFYERAAAVPAPIANEALTRIAELYRIEGEIRGRSPEERCRADRSAAAGAGGA